MRVVLALIVVWFSIASASSQPTEDYRPQVWAETVAPTPFPQIDSLVSINDFGQVSFAGRDATFSRLFVVNNRDVASGVQDYRALDVIVGSTRDYRGAAISNSSAPWVASRERVSGSPPTYFIRRWSYDGSPLQKIAQSGSLFDSALSFLDINDSGLVAFPALTAGSTKSALFAGTADPPTKLVEYSGTVSLRPQLDNLNRAVIRDPSARVVLVSYPSKAQEVVASGFATMGISPGISSSGDVIAFIGDRGSGTGVFASIRRPDGTRQIFTLAGEASTTFSAFDIDQRAGTASYRLPIGTWFRVVFQATRSGVAGVFAIDGLFQDGVGLSLSPPKTVVRVGDQVATAKQSTAVRTVQSTSLYDPVNAAGSIAMWATFTDGSNGIVFADLTPDYKQGDPHWGDEIHGNGIYTLKDKGCQLTACTDTVNYYARAYGQETDVKKVNDWLKVHGGFTTIGNNPIHEKCAEYARTVTAEWPVAVPLYYRGEKRGQDDAGVEDWLRKNRPIILRVKSGVQSDGHSVVATGRVVSTLGPSFRLANPGRLEMTRAQLTNYNSTYARVLKFAESPPVSVTALGDTSTGLEILRFEATEGVQIVVEDPQGRRTGVDPATGAERLEIPESSYHDEVTVNDETGQQFGVLARSIEILLAAPGQYRVIARGATAGDYTLETISYDHDGGQRRDLRTQQLTVAQIAVTNVDYSDAVGGATLVQDGPTCLALVGSPVLSVAKLTLSWTASTNSTAYDIVRGDLDVLRSGGGNFGTATSACVGNDVASTSIPFAEVPPTASGWWILVRPVNCGGPGTYDDTSPGRVGSRDAGIHASVARCP